MVIAEAEILHVIDRALEGMSRILATLGDGLGNLGQLELTRDVLVAGHGGGGIARPRLTV